MSDWRWYLDVAPSEPKVHVMTDQDRLFKAIAEGAGYEAWLHIRDKLIEADLPYTDPWANKFFSGSSDRAKPLPDWKCPLCGRE